MKLKDKYADTADISLKEKSVLSGKTLKQIEANPQKIYGKTIIQPGTSKKDDKNSKKIINPKKIAPGKKNKADATIGRKTAFPLTTEPMLATLVDKPFDEEGWVYEVKWDGYRAVAHIRDKKSEPEIQEQ